MREAAVGFQCPECVSQGRKDTRAARTAYGGLMPSRHGIVSMTIIGINAAIWLLILATGGATSRWVDQLALRPKGLCLAQGGGFDTSQAFCTSHGGSWLPGVSDGATYQLLTSMFTQVEVLHIGFNMLFLWILGPQLELMLGRLRFVGLYLLSGLVGSAMVYWFSGEYTSTLGASGAIFGLMGAMLVMAYKVKADMTQLLMWIGLNVALSFFGNSNVSWQGHLGGFIGGVALAVALAYAPRERRTAWQGAGFALVGVLVVVAVVARTAMLT